MPDALSAQEERPQGHGFGTAPVFWRASARSSAPSCSCASVMPWAYRAGGRPPHHPARASGHRTDSPCHRRDRDEPQGRGRREYFIISRSFGTTIGGAIGIFLYLSQAISVAFYMIAFAEAVRPLAPFIESTLGVTFDPRMVSLPAMLLLVSVVLRKGADLGVKALWVVASILGLSRSRCSSLGSRAPESHAVRNRSACSPIWTTRIAFMLVFAIVFPAFTGMTAGVGLSGDLAATASIDPHGDHDRRRSTGMLVYVLVVVKLGVSSVTADELAANYLIMSEIAIWGPIIPDRARVCDDLVGDRFDSGRTDGHSRHSGADAVIPRPAAQRATSPSGCRRDQRAPERDARHVCHRDRLRPSSATSIWSRASCRCSSW